MKVTYYLLISDMVHYILVDIPNHHDASEIMYFPYNSINFKAEYTHGSDWQRLLILFNDPKSILYAEIELEFGGKHFSAALVLNHNSNMLEKHIIEACDLMIIYNIQES